MEHLERILSRPSAKPYRSRNIKDAETPYLNKDGHLDFAPDDIENPRNWSLRRRWYITVVSILLVVNATFASSSPSGCLGSISELLEVSEEASGLVITVYLLGYCAGPFLFAPLSEFYGRRWIFYGTFICYIAFNILCAFTPNFGGLLVGRFLTGTFAAAPLSNSPGVLADLWGPIERQKSMAIFSVFTFVGPALGPVISGFFQVTKDFRWNFYVLLMLAAITFPFMLTLPETLASQVLYNKAQRIRRMKIPGYENVISPVEASERKLLGIFKIALTRPWRILFDPIAFLCAIYLSVVYMLLYMLFSIYPIVFQQHRGWNAGVGELPLIGTVIGAALGGAFVFWAAAQNNKKLIAGTLKPEDRLIVGMYGAVLFPVTMFWFSWSAAYNEVHWIVPTLAGVFLSSSILLIFVAILNYLVESYLFMAASALAGNTVMRSALAASAPLWTNQMFSALGIGGGGSLIAGVAVLLAPIPFMFYWYGERIRVRSPFAPTDQGAGPSKTPAPEAAHDESSDDERALDEEAGVPDPEKLQEEIEKKRQSLATSSRDGDPYIDASGLEKAER